MRGFLKQLILDAHKVLTDKENDEYRYEIDRYFRQLVPGLTPSSPKLAGDALFKGNHTLDARRHLFPRVSYYTAVTDAANMTPTGEYFRYRRKATATNLAPAQPGQIAFAMGRISAAESGSGSQSPLSCYSSVDVNLQQIGAVFGHPVGREAYFNETAVTPVGVGILSNGGPLAFAVGEEGHYIYLIRIATTGNATAATYWYQRVPYLKGAFYPGSAQPDNSAGAEILAERFRGGLGARSHLPLNGINRPEFLPNRTSPVPSVIPYNLEFPTADALSAGTPSRLVNMCFDGVADGGRIWMAYVDQVENGGVNPVRSRAIWAWKRMCGESPNRYDAAAGSGGDATMPNFPTLAGNVQFRDIRAGRGGFVYVACDGVSDGGSGSANTGALLMINANPITGTGDTITADTPTAGTARLDDAGASFPTNIVGRTIRIASATAPGNNGDFLITARNSATQIEYANDGAVTVTEAFTWELLDTVTGVTDVFGTTAAGIYTQGGFLSNDVLAVTVDRGENRAAAGDDRVWVLHRNGLSFFDVTVATGAVSAVQTVDDGTAPGTFTGITANSIRGLGGFQPVGTGGIQNWHRPLLDHDTNGDVYWVSTQTGGTHQSGVNRLNKLVTDDSAAPGSMTHSFFSIDTVAEGGALGYIQMGTGASAQDSIVSLKVHRRDHDDALAPTTGDPAPDDIWVSTGEGDNQASSCNIAQIPVDQFTVQNNPGIRYFGDTLATGSTDYVWFVQVAPDGQAWALSSADQVGLLGSAYSSSNFNRVRQTTTESVTLAGPGGAGSYTITMTNPFFDATNFAHLRKRLVIEGAGTPGNNGSFQITAIASALQATIFIPNAGAGNETASMTVRMQGTDFDSRSTTAGGDGGWQNFGGTECLNAEMYPDDSGCMYDFDPRQSASDPTWLLYNTTPLTWQRDTVNNVWYRSRVPHPEQPVTDGSVKTAHTAQEALDNGVTVAFANSGAGGDEFVEDEYYSFPVSIGLIKAATQELTWKYDIFHEKTDLFILGDEPDLTASNQTARGGFIDIGSLANVQTDNPFRDLGTPANVYTSLTNARQALLLSHYQQRLAMTGTNNTETIAAGAATISTTDGPQLGLDVGSNVVASSLRFFISGFPTNTFSAMQIDLYSALAADLDNPVGGQIDWGAPRLTYRQDQDSPNWILQHRAFNDVLDSNTGIGGVSIEVDLAQAALDGNLANPVTNDAMRFWKVAIKLHTGLATSQAFNLVCMVAFNTSGAPIGVSSNQYLSFVNDTNYLANLVTRAVFVQDTGTGSAAITGGNTVTLTADTFNNVAVNDYFRNLTNGEEALITDVTGLPTVIVTAGGLTNASGQDWEVVRNADVRPRDDEGGGEDQAEFPPTGAGGEGQVFICPITGWIAYNDNDVTATRTFRAERVVKVKRSL